jgi:hypothetical protein
MSWVHISRLNGRIAKSGQNGINADACEALVEHFGLLLSISRGAVKTVLFLNLGLQQNVSVCFSQVSQVNALDHLHMLQ